MVAAEMTRAEVEATPFGGDRCRNPRIFTGKRLSGLNLSGLDLTGAIFRAAAAEQDQARWRKNSIAPSLDQAWLLEGGSHRRKPEGRQSVRVADARRPARRRRSQPSAGHGPNLTGGKPGRSLDYRCEPGAPNMRKPVNGG